MSFTLKRGLDDIYAAEIIEDSAAAYSTGTPFHLIPAGEMTVTVDNESTEFFFDNTVFATVGREGKTEIGLTGAGLRAAAIANLNGKHVDSATGAVIDDGQFHTKYYALGGRKKNIDGSFEYFWFQKGSFKIPDDSGKTEDDSTDATGTELTFTAIPTTHKFTVDGESKTNKRVVIDTETSAIVDGADWFAQVVTPDNLASIVERAATPTVLTYILTLNANGGTGEMDPVESDAVGDAEIPANTFTKWDYTFTGWNTKADGTGTAYASGDTINMSADTTLYAIWTEDETT